MYSPCDSPVAMSYEDSYLDGLMAAARSKKKTRLASTMSVTSFHDIYSLDSLLGQGSYGRVMTGTNLYTGAEVAVKVISTSSPFFSRSKVLKEIELYYLCSDVPEIIQLLEYFEEDEHFYLVFEKARGGTLFSRLASQKVFTEAQSRCVIRDLASALSFLHSHGIAHRDIKPENVLCLDEDSPVPVRLCDFDLCSSLHPTIDTPRLASPVGSAEYMAPEIVATFEDNEDYSATYDKNCDLWSLGVLLYILLSGRMPFVGSCGYDCGWDYGEDCAQCQESLFASIERGEVSFPHQYWSGVSASARALVSSLLVREPSKRLQAKDILNHPWIAGDKGEYCYGL